MREAQRAPTDPPAPLPRWRGIAVQEQQDKTHRLLRLKRHKKPSQAQLREIEQLRQDLHPREGA